MKSKRYLRHLVLASVGSALTFANLAAAQSPDQQHTFNIPAGSLAQAAATFTAQTGIQVSIRATGAEAARVNGVSGTYSDQDAFARLLAASGLSWHQDGNTIVVDGSVSDAPSEGRMLSAVRVEGTSGVNASAGGLAGFGLGAGANGSSDVTATEGTRSLAASGASVATKTAVSLKDIPQSISVITAEQIQLQNRTNVQSALEATPGITIVTTPGNNSNTIISRGYAVSTYTVDGGAPMAFSTYGGGIASADTSMYDHIEVLKGSAGTFGGASAPGGTINLERKRPLDHQQLIVTGQAGSWAYKRGEVDYSTPLAFHGALRARFDVAWQDNDSFTDYTHQNLWNLYGVVEADLNPDTLVRVGGNYRRIVGRGEQVNGLPLFGNGADLNLPTSTNLTTPYARSTVRNDEQFYAFEHRFSDTWKLSSTGTRKTEQSPRLAPIFQGLYIDQAGNNLYYLGDGFSNATMTQYVAEAHLNGTVQFLGHDQKFVVGGDYQKINSSALNLQRSGFAMLNVFNPNYAAIPAFQGPLTTQNSPGNTGTTHTQQWGLYATAMLEPIAKFHVNGGVRMSNYTRTQSTANIRGGITSVSTIVVSGATDHFTFNGSLTYDVTKVISLYASYADIFDVNDGAQTASGGAIPPRTGRTYEAGVKTALADGKLNGSVAFFASNQYNIPISTVRLPTNPLCCFVGGGEQKSKGIELQLSGEITKNWQINAGYTYLDTKYNDAYLASITGGINGVPATLTQQPKHQLKIFTTYTLPWAPKITVTGSLRLDSARYTNGVACPTVIPVGSFSCSQSTVPYQVTQPTYAVGDLGAEYRATKNWSLAANLTNISNTKYYATNYTFTNGNFYGEPRRILFTLRGKY